MSVYNVRNIFIFSFLQAAVEEFFAFKIILILIYYQAE